MKRIAVFCVTFVVFATVFLLVEHASPFFQTCISQESSQAGYHAGDEGYGSIGAIISYTRCSGRFIDGHGSGITAFFTIILAASTILLWLVTNKAADAARIAAEHIPRVERAYIFGGIADGDTSFSNDGKTIFCKISVSNHGKTPGILLEVRGEFLNACPNVGPKQFRFSDPKGPAKYDLVISPGNERITLGNSYAGEYASPTFFVACVKYRDIFGEEHASYWCLAARKLSQTKGDWIAAGAPGWDYFD